MSKNKKKTAREKRILVGAFLTAVVIAAGSTFAWFTSSDAVTNRLSANADYDVKIVESFAPPANWLPGQEVDKDVYAVNTGSIEAFVRATISGRMSVTREEIVSTLAPSETSVPVTANVVFNLEPYTVNVYRDGNNFYGKSGDTWLALNYDEDNKTYTATAIQASNFDLPEENALTNTTSVGDWTGNVYDADEWANLTNKKTSALEYENTAELYELDENERYAIEAGAYLASKPTGSNAKLGDQLVLFTDKGGNPQDAYNTAPSSFTVKQGGTDVDGATVSYYNGTYTVVIPSSGTPGEAGYNAGGAGTIDESAFDAEGTATVTINNNNYTVTKETDKYATDFTPDAEGLYVFRKYIDVVENGYETFEYDGYYYKDGKYYKVANLTVVSDDKIDRAGDDSEYDGQLSYAYADFVQLITEHIDPVELTYEDGNHRLVAKYNAPQSGTRTDATGDQNTVAANLATLAANLDKAEHNLAAAQAALDRAYLEDESTNDKEKQYTDLITTLTQQKAALEQEIADLEAQIEVIKDDITDATNNDGQKEIYETANLAADAAVDALAGDATPTTDHAVVAANITGDSPAGDYSGVDGTFKVGDETYIISNGKIYKGSVSDANEVIAERTSKDGAKGWSDLDTEFGTGSAHDYGDAFEKLKGWEESYASDTYVGLFVQEMINKYSSTYEGINESSTYPDIVNALGYDVLEDELLAAGANLPADDLHSYWVLLDTYLTNKAKYESDLANAETKLNDMKKAAEALGKTSGITTETAGSESGALDIVVPNADGTPGTAEKYAQSTVNPKTDDSADNSGLLNDLAELQAKLNTARAKNTAYGDAIANAIVQRTDAGTYGTGVDYGTADDNVDAAKAAYDTAYKAYEAALAAYNKASGAADTVSEIEVYINLENDVTYGGVAEKWQLLPTASPMPEATFYYTSILEPGKVSEQLVQSVTLSDKVTQDTYKYFDFDLNIELDSAQITYANDNKTILPDAANEAFDYTANVYGENNTVIQKKYDVTAALADSTNLDTAVTWSEEAKT